jgi:hypothetical protein
MREVTGNNSIGATTEQDRNQLLIGVGFGSGLLIGLAAYLSAPASRRLIDALQVVDEPYRCRSPSPFGLE